MPLSNDTKGKLSVLSAIIFNVICGSLNTWSSINGYYMSYLRMYDPKIQLVDGYFIRDIISFTSMCIGPLVALLDSKIGVKYTILISSILNIISNLTIYYSTNLYIIYCSMFALGFIMCANYLPIIRNALLYFPDKKGLINGLILFSFGSGSFIYIFLADSIINPEFKKMNPQTHYFDDDIARNVKIYFKYFNILNNILIIIGYLILFEYEKDENEKNEKEKLTEKKNDDVKTLEVKEKKISMKSALCQALQGIQFYQLVAMTTTLSMTQSIITNTYRTFGQEHAIDEHLLSIVSRINSILQGFARLGWGLLFDKFTFKSLFFTCIFGELAVCFMLNYSAKYHYLFYVIISIQSIVAGKVSLNVSMFTKIFGINYFGFIYSFGSFIGGFFNASCPFIIKFVVRNKSDYRTLYFVVGIMNLIALVALFTFKDKPFEYKLKDEKEDGKKEVELEEKLN